MLPSPTALGVFIAVLCLLVGPRWLVLLILYGIMAVLITALVDGTVTWSVLGILLLLAVVAGLRGVAVGLSATAGWLRRLSAKRR